MSPLPEAIVITDVGLRDGLQNEAARVSLDDREAIARELARAGLPRLEVGAFVRPDLVPRMADSEALLTRIDDLAADVELCAIAPNARGVQRAAGTAVAEIRLFLSASEGHSRANTGRSVDQGLEAVLAAVEAASTTGKAVGVGIATAFVCPFDGNVSPEVVTRLVRSLADAGIDRFTLADTIGKAHPGQVRDTLLAVREASPEVQVGLHLHDTYGTGMANAWVGLEAGVIAFDASVGGTGGCPFAPGAAGNIATEDLVFLCEAAGVSTGVDLERLTAVAATLPALLGHRIDSHQARIRTAGA